MIREVVLRCNKCNDEVTFDRDLVTDGYLCACLNCDEDLFSFEVHGDPYAV